MPNFPAFTGLAQVRPFALITATQAVLATTVLALCPPVQAQSASQEPAYGLSGRIGLNVVSMPTYEGSPNTRTLAGPDLTLSYRSREWGSVEFGQRGLFWNAIEAGQFRFGLVAQFDPGRKDRDTSAVNPTPGDKRLAGMGSVKSSTEVGVGIGFGPVTLVARQSLGERGAKGAQADLTAEIPWLLTDRLNLRFAAGATWANSDYMQAYFGVTAAHVRPLAEASAFSPGRPKSLRSRLVGRSTVRLRTRWSMRSRSTRVQNGLVFSGASVMR